MDRNLTYLNLQRITTLMKPCCHVEFLLPWQLSLVERCLGKAKVPGPNPGQGSYIWLKEQFLLYSNFQRSENQYQDDPSLLLAEEIKPFFIDRGNSNSRNVCSFLLISLLNLYSYTFDTFSSCIHSISILDNNAGLKLLFQGIPYYSFSYFQLLLNSFFKATLYQAELPR